MKSKTTSGLLISAAALTMAATGAQAVSLIANGSFEAGLSSWSTTNQIGSDGTFFSQTGSSSPVNGFSVAAPVHGLRAAMTDSGAGGSHVLSQDFIVPTDVTAGSVSFQLYLNNGAETYFNVAHLDWAQFNQNGTLNLNQQARVDIITTAADPFSTAPADVLTNLFRTDGTTPAVTGYNAFSFDLSAFFVAHAGETLRLRFAETDNVNFFNFGVDDVSVTAVPAPAAGLLALGSLAAASRRRRHR